LIRRSDAGGWDITNLGAVLFAKRLDAFHPLRRKAVRVVQYRGTGRTETLREQAGGKGYACGFEGLIGYINGLLPANEVIGEALRKSVPMFPELAVRELVANALIHQDFFVTGAGPMVEIFDDRIEITNPGEPLVDTQRFVDTPPRSRNETLASLMRRFRICEERGSGIDKVVFQVELFQLPAPLFEKPEGFTRTVLFSHKPLSAMDRAERVRACYLHACLRYVMRQPMTNTSVRERFGIAEKNASVASRLLNEAIEAGRIVVEDPAAGTRARSYLPFWAVPGRLQEGNA
jgi:predicted HTH transcriptional regulator